MDARVAAELSNVLTALEHAGELFGTTPPDAPTSFVLAAGGDGELAR
ncbi:hypothetical protein LV457_12165 [Mycobacterium sp. MYCO198283]|nr:hypothetical protein [Mycobacterium sp. MYCO198283]MCG5433036.1 hypothetical protein [Mycobacterium sp. MYCO198283]